MSIYQRDNINYGGLLGNAMANRMAYAQRDADIQRQMGQNWADAINQGAQGIAAGLNTWNQQRIDQDKLAQQQQFQAEQKAQEWANAIERAREQQKWQAEQNALNRQNTYDIALMNKGVANQERQAQNIMNYQNAIAQQKYAEDMLFNARPGSIEYLQAQKALQESKNKADYYKDMIPHQLWEVDAAPQPITGDAAEVALKQFGTPAPLPKWQEEDLLAEWNALDKRSGGKYDDATAKRMNEIADMLNNESLRVQIATKGATTEQRQAALAQELADARAQFAANGTYDNKKFKIKYSNGKASLVRK